MLTKYNPLSLFSLPPLKDEPKPTPSAITVDPMCDMFWVGSTSGHVSSFVSPLTLNRNVQFIAHGSRAESREYIVMPGVHAGVRQIRATDREIWTLTDGGIGGRTRGGLPKWSVSDANRTLRAMTPSPTNSHEILAGGSGQMMLVNISRGEIVRRYESLSTIVHLGTQSRTVVSASMGGQVAVLDPRTGFRNMAKVQPVQAHTGGMNGADAQGNIVCTWGWTHVQGHPTPDPLVRLYDTRSLRALPPISFPNGPAFVLLNPIDPSKLVISSQIGLIQVVDLSTGSSEFQQLDVSSYLTSMAMSPQGDYLTFGDADGQIHLWTLHPTDESAHVNENGSLILPPFNGYDGGVQPWWPDLPDTPPPIAWDEQTPLNIIGMPRYEEPLLSNFTPSDYATVYSPFFNPPEPIPASILATVNYQDFVGYGQLPKELRGKRNVVTARAGAGKLALGRGADGPRRQSEPRFRSEKLLAKNKSQAAEIDEDEMLGEIPKYYRKVEIKYSKFGVEDFDFGFYNRTQYSGLETDILNSYTNALLQALHYTLPIRSVAKAHICVDCQKEHCLLCEAGFLFRMLEDAKGTNCQASNFSRAFSATSQASALGLMDMGEKSSSPLGSLIQNFNRWLLSTFSNEAVIDGQTYSLRQAKIENISLHPPLPINQILGVDITTVNTCLSCRYVSTRHSQIHTIDLTYPRRPSDASSFPEVLRSAIFRSANTKATCLNCKEFTPLSSRRGLASSLESSLPAVLSINAMASSPEVAEIWKDRHRGGRVHRYLPPTIAFRTDSEGEIVIDSEGSEGIVYEVRSIVVQVQISSEHPAHLVSFVKMPVENGEAQWILFNDFLVRQVKEEDVFSFADLWKIPAVIILERTDSSTILDYSKLPTELDHDVLFQDFSMAWHRRASDIQHQVLSPQELPVPGTLVAIDAEFVALQQEEMEFRSDGTKKLLRPSHMSLARVSVLRGEGELESVPFIDDYIRTTEPVVDYLTEYSGIKAGDLDPANSTHTLVPLKVAYKKLRLLVDRGCVFIGHGLSKDFRTINIFVPPEQVLDTVNIYTIPGRSRKLSLRFLSWFLLKKDIQTKEHDSIEDARYALLLYQLFNSFSRDGRFEDVMEDIFIEGHKTGFKPPLDRPPTPSSFPPLQTVQISTPPPSQPTRAINTSTAASVTAAHILRSHTQPTTSVPPQVPSWAVSAGQTSVIFPTQSRRW